MMPAGAAEHDYYTPAPIIDREPLRWQNGARLALALVVNIEFYELQPALGAFIPPNLPGGFGRGPYPDFRNYTHRDYGPRVGLFRLMELLGAKGITATAAIDARTAIERPVIVEHCRRRGWEIAAHGRAVTDVISSHLSEDEERAYIRASLAAVSQVAGVAPRGWHGAEYGESHRTVRLLAESGIDYVLDWPNDEQPYVMRAGGRELLALPMSADLDDVIAHWHHKISMARWRRAVIDAVDRLRADGERSGRLLILNLHPWLIGQAFRSTYLTEVLDHALACADVWVATAGEIATAYRDQIPP